MHDHSSRATNVIFQSLAPSSLNNDISFSLDGGVEEKLKMEVCCSNHAMKFACHRLVQLLFAGHRRRAAQGGRVGILLRAPDANGDQMPSG
jgi:hypothetical protein